MIEVVNKLYIQRFFAKSLKWSDIFLPVTYTQYERSENIPFYYKKISGESCTLDLTQSLEDLLSGMKSNTRNEIKRAEKEGIYVEYNKDYESFVPFYNTFCQSKGLDDEINVHTLAKYDETIITMAKYNDMILAMHATVINKKDKEAMLLYSCSMRLTDGVDRKMIGWGNRYLHYKEFLLFKEWGIERYEWNGICTNPERKDVYNISLFKLAFGGTAKATIGLRTPLFVIMKKIQGILK